MKKDRIIENRERERERERERDFIHSHLHTCVSTFLFTTQE